MRLDLHIAADDLMGRSPHRVAVIDTDGEWTYAELRAAVLAATARLRAAGVSAGDRIGIVDASGRLSVAAIFAAMRLGAIPAPLNPRLTPAEVQTLNDLAVSARVVVVGEAYRDRVEGLDVPILGHDLLDPTDGDDSPSTDEGTDAVLLFTSGTTGLPKPVMVPAASLKVRLVPYVEPEVTQVRMLCAPIHHIGGLMGLLVALLGGHTLVIQPRFDAADWLRLVAAHRVESMFIVPTMLARITAHPSFATTDLSSLQTITYGASPMTDDLITRLTEVMPHVGFINTFGQTETLGGITLSDPADAHHPIHRTSVGKLVPGARARVVTPGTDDDLPTGSAGELLISSPQNVTAGWIRTGDIVRIDEDGYLYPEGRLSDTINRGGEKFGPIEVETALRTHPLVTDCAVAGVPDPELNERVGAVVVVSEPVDLVELRQWCASLIASFKLPERVVFVTEVPLTDMNKIDRLAVVRLVEGC